MKIENEKLLAACMGHTKEFLYEAYNEAARQHGIEGLREDVLEFTSNKLIAEVVIGMIVLTYISQNNINFRIDPQGKFTIKI